MLRLNDSPKLTDVNCETNYELFVLDIFELSKLKTLICSNTNLSSLDINNLTNLTSVTCHDSQLTRLDLTNLINLEAVNFDYNKISSITFDVLPKLKKLSFLGNKMTSLKLSGLDNLEYLNCTGNLITSLNIDNRTKLEGISCAGNLLTSLELTHLPKLITIQAEKNLLESVTISDCPNLQILVLYNNKLISVDANEFKKLTSLDLDNNANLVSLSIKNGSPEKQLYTDVSKCPNLKYICTDDFKLKPVQNMVDQLGYTNCNVNSYCTFVPGGDFYTIKGNTKYDENANGCDADDINFPSLKLSISDNTTIGESISGNLGSYSIPVSAGTYTLKPVLEKPNYYTINPSTVNIVFSGQANPFIQDFCVKANGAHPDLEITVIPIEAARPGFVLRYKVVYLNKGTMTQSGTINLNFDDSILEFVTSNPVVSSQKTNNLNWSFTNLLPFESREITLTMKVNRPTEIPPVRNGDILKYLATIASAETDETPLDNTFALNQIVVGSYDPNDKTCLEGDIITPSLIGEYVHYMIRFENTGTYHAENIVVKDMIDLNKFDISTLIPTSSSHQFVTKISENNKVEFIFENINLPFDDANNDGYIAFKIKTKPTLIVGDSFTNEANIYFDYNFPILTNKATSKFEVTLGTKNFEFSNYFTLYPNPVKEVLNIGTTHSIEIQSLAIYDILGQLVIAVPNAKSVSNIDVSKLRTGNYFIKVKSDKGSSSMKFIKQ